MARRGRRGGGPPIGGTLGTLLRSTLEQVSEQVGVVREVVERQTRVQRKRFDTAMVGRRHREALMELGDFIVELAERDQLGPVGKHREVIDLLNRIVELEAEMAAAERSDQRAAGSRSGEKTPRERWGRGPRENEPGASFRQRGSSGAAHPNPEKSDGRIWRPNLSDIDEAEWDEFEEDELDDGAVASGAIPGRPAPAPARTRTFSSGGITFEDDDEAEDLEEYMHDDDVPEPSSSPK